MFLKTFVVFWGPMFMLFTKSILPLKLQNAFHWQNWKAFCCPSLSQGTLIHIRIPLPKGGRVASCDSSKNTKQVIHRLLFSVQSPVGEMLLAGWAQNKTSDPHLMQQSSTHFQMWQINYANLHTWDFSRAGECTDVMSGKKIQGYCWKSGGSLLCQTTCIVLDNCLKLLFLKNSSTVFFTVHSV